MPVARVTAMAVGGWACTWARLPPAATSEANFHVDVDRQEGYSLTEARSSVARSLVVHSLVPLGGSIAL